jgi:hypothetical protein
MRLRSHRPGMIALLLPEMIGDFGGEALREEKVLT